VRCVQVASGFETVCGQHFDLFVVDKHFEEYQFAAFERCDSQWTDKFLFD